MAAAGRVASGEEERQQYRKLIHELSQELTHENVKSIAFLSNSSKRQRGKAACTCHSHGDLVGNSGLDLLEILWEKGVFGEDNVEPLIELLKEISRVDLVSRCLTYKTEASRREQLQQTSPLLATERGKPSYATTLPPKLILRGESMDDLTLPNVPGEGPGQQRQRSTSTPHSCQLHDESVESDFSSLGHSLTTPLSEPQSCDPESGPTCELRRRQFRDSKPKDRDSGLVCSPCTSMSSLSISEEGEGETTPIGHTPLYDVPRNKRNTFEWKLPRSGFIAPLFFHKNGKFHKKWKFSSGSRLKVDLDVFLYPNGINWDQDMFSTIKVEITKLSRSPPSTTFLQFHITGFDSQAGNVICSRQVECPFNNKEFVIQQFLSHEVIKESRAKYFEFRASVCVGYCFSDWELIDNAT